MTDTAPHGEHREAGFGRAEEALRGALRPGIADDPAALDRVLAASRARRAATRPPRMPLGSPWRIALIGVIAAAIIATTVVAVGRNWTPTPEYVVQRALAALARDARGGGVMHEVTTQYSQTPKGKVEAGTVTEAWSTTDGRLMRISPGQAGSKDGDATTVVAHDHSVMVSGSGDTRFTIETFGMTPPLVHYRFVTSCQACHGSPYAGAPGPDGNERARLVSMLSGSVQTFYRSLLTHGRWSVQRRGTVGNVPVWVLRAPSPLYKSESDTLVVYVDRRSYLPIGMARYVAPDDGGRALLASRATIDHMRFPPGLPFPSQWFELPAVPAHPTGGYSARIAASEVSRFTRAPIYWLGREVPAQLWRPPYPALTFDSINLNLDRASKKSTGVAATRPRESYEIAYMDPDASAMADPANDTAPFVDLAAAPTLSLASLRSAHKDSRFVEASIGGHAVVLEFDRGASASSDSGDAKSMYVRFPEGLSVRITTSGTLSAERIQLFAKLLRKAN